MVGLLGNEVEDQVQGERTHVRLTRYCSPPRTFAVNGLCLCLYLCPFPSLRFPRRESRPLLGLITDCLPATEAYQASLGPQSARLH